jgi:hypothetical protein
MTTGVLDRSQSSATRGLIAASLAFLALPVALFLAGWLRWYLALPLLALLLLALLAAVRGTVRPAIVEGERTRRPSWHLRHLVPLLVVATLLLGMSGIGGIGFQDTDWLKHNAVLKDLSERPWPVTYEFHGKKIPLVYYVAYYLPAAAVGKAFGWTAANWVLFAWSLAGVILTLLWFQLLARRAGWRTLLLFAVFSGLDIAGQLFTRQVIAPIRPEVDPLLTWTHLEGWAVGWQYSANATLLFWVPNQALAGWLVTGLVAHTVLHSSRKDSTLFSASLAAFWSPFVALGLLPFLVASWLVAGGRWGERIKRLVSLPNLGGAILITVAGLYYSAKLYPVSPQLAASIPHGFFWDLVSDPQGRMLAGATMVVFCVLEFGLYGILICGARSGWSARTKALYLPTIIILLLIPLYRYGAMNDLAMRASIPALFVLCLLVARALNSSLTGLPVRIGLVLLVALGSATAFVEFNRHIKGIYDAGAIRGLPPAAGVASVNEWGITTERDAAIVLQYLGGLQAPFFRYLARQDN